MGCSLRAVILIITTLHQASVQHFRNKKVIEVSSGETAARPSGSCLYFPQSILNLEPTIYSRNTTLCYVKGILDKGETGEMKYDVVPLSKTNLIQLGIEESGRLFFISEENEVKGSLKSKESFKFRVEAKLDHKHKDQLQSKASMEIILNLTNGLPREEFIKGCPVTNKELCFGSNSNITLSVMENSKEEELLYLGFHQSLCFNNKINYTLISIQSDGVTRPKFEKEPLILKKMENRGGYEFALNSQASLDREFIDSYNFTLICTISSTSADALMDTQYVVKTNLTLNILDENDNAPEMYYEEVVYIKLDSDLNNPVISGMDRLQPEGGHNNALLLNDKDTQEVNNFDLKVHNDTRNLLKFNFFLTPWSEWNKMRATHYQIKLYPKNKSLSLIGVLKDEQYCVLISVADTAYNQHKDGFPEVTVTVCLYSGKRMIPKTNSTQMQKEKLDEILKNRTLEGNFTRTATILTRIFEPFPALVLDKSEMTKVPELDFRIDKCRAFQTSYDEVECTEENPFKITPHSAIIYLAANMKNENVEKLILTLSWKTGIDDEAIRARDNFTIYLEGEGGQIPGCDQTCAQQTTQDECEMTCGPGTLGSCLWNYDPHNESGVIPFITCSPNLDTCPNEICDELEAIYPALCPQDCTTRVTGIGHLKKRTDGQSHGLQFGDGICACSNPDPLKEGFCDCWRLRGFYSENSTKSTTEITSVPKIDKEAFEHYCGESCVALFIIGFITLTLLVALIICTTRRKTKGAKLPDDIPLGSIRRDSTPTDPPFVRTTGKNDPHMINALKMIDPAWEIPRASLQLRDILGEGEFGRVHKALASDVMGHPGERIEVALKALKENNSENGKSSYSEFIAEYSLLKQVDNPNVIKLLGACTQTGGPWYLVLEYAEHGSLRGFLRKSRRLPVDSSGCGKIDPAFDSTENYLVTPADILGFSWQIAKGMNYLSEIKMVHRDLAARNVLLTKDRVCKISDFGLTRDIYIDDTYQKKSKDKVPVKWLAPECLADELYTMKSDVWSFGITLWEIVNLGVSPYPGVTNENLFSLIREGYRMPLPKNCSIDLYNIMRHCWEYNPEYRPTFKQLVFSLSKLMEQNVDYLSFDSTVVSNPGYNCVDLEREALLNRNSNFHQTNFSYEDSQREDLEMGPVCYEPTQFYPRTYVNQLARKEEISHPVVQSNSFYEIPIKL